MTFRRILLSSILLFGLAGNLHAQGSRKDDIVFNSRGQPLAGVNVAVCTQPAVTTTNPCSPLANLYSNAALTQALANPTTTDGMGNYSFYAAPGKYTVQIYGPGITTKVMPDVILPSDPSSPTFSSVTTTSGISAFSLTLSGNLTVGGSVSVAGSFLPAAIGNVQLASGQAGATDDLKIQAAINALPTGGGTAFVDLCGSQTIASDVFSGVTKAVHLVWTCGTHSFSVNTTFPKNITNEFKAGAMWSVPTGVAVNTRAGIIAGNYQIFTLAGTGVVNPLQGQVGTGRLNVMWWGATWQTFNDFSACNDATSAVLAATNAAIAGLTGTVYFPPAPSITGGQESGFRIGFGASCAAGTTVTLPSVSGKWVVWELGADVFVGGGSGGAGIEVGTNHYKFTATPVPDSLNQASQFYNPFVRIRGWAGFNANPLIHVGAASGFRLDGVALTCDRSCIVFDRTVNVHMSRWSADFNSANTADSLVLSNTGSNSFRYLFEHFTVTGNNAASSQPSFLFQPTANDSGIRMVTFRNFIINYQGIKFTNNGTGVTASHKWIQAEHGLYESAYVPLMTYDNAAFAGSYGGHVVLYDINSADDVASSPLLAITGNAGQTVSGFTLINSVRGTQGGSTNAIVDVSGGVKAEGIVFVDPFASALGVGALVSTSGGSTAKWTTLGNTPWTSTGVDWETNSVLGAKFIRATQATAHVAGDYALSAGWGTSPSVSAVAATDMGGRVSVTSGTGTPTPNPTLTLTFKDGTKTNAPSCPATRGDTNSPTADWRLTTITATAATWTFVGTPAASTAYVLDFTCMGR